jgi:hypothetical protein
MKKINVKKLNQFYTNQNNAPELKSLVMQAVENYTCSTNGDVPNVHYISILQDLGLLSDV